MSDLYHLLLETRHHERLGIDDGKTRQQASSHLMHLLSIAIEADLLQIQVSDSEENFAVIRAETLSVDEENFTLLIGGSKVVGHNGGMPKIECDHESCMTSHSRSFADAFGAAAYAGNPNVSSALDDLRARARAFADAGDETNAKALEEIARRLDIRPLSAK